MIAPHRDQSVLSLHVRCPSARLLAALLVVLSLVGAAWAQDCSGELLAAVPGGATSAQVATALATTALEAIEPAMPARRPAPNHLGGPNARWLHERGFLPAGWNDDGDLDPVLWAQLLANLQTPYRVEPRPTSGRIDTRSLLSETQTALQRVASAVRPLALVATEPGNRQKIVSVNVIWNWTPWPRLLIFEPVNLAFGPEDDISEVLSGIGTCAWRPRAYFRTDANTASNYYMGNAEARVRLLATDLGSVATLVPPEQEATLFAFKGDMLRGASVAAVGFEGPGPSTWQVIKFLTNAQSNVGAFDLPYYMSFP